MIVDERKRTIEKLKTYAESWNANMAKRGSPNRCRLTQISPESLMLELIKDGAPSGTRNVARINETGSVEWINADDDSDNKLH